MTPKIMGACPYCNKVLYSWEIFGIFPHMCSEIMEHILRLNERARTKIIRAEKNEELE